MLQIVIKDTKCTGLYWIEGHPGHWERVTGTVIGVSKKVTAENTRGVAYQYSKVNIRTSQGMKTAYIMQGSQKTTVTEGGVSLEKSTVGRLPKFKDGKLNGGYSKKVTSN